MRRREGRRARANSSAPQRCHSAGCPPAAGQRGQQQQVAASISHVCQQLLHLRVRCCHVSQALRGQLHPPRVGVGVVLQLDVGHAPQVPGLLRGWGGGGGGVGWGGRGRGRGALAWRLRVTPPMEGGGWGLVKLPSHACEAAVVRPACLPVGEGWRARAGVGMSGGAGGA